MILRRSGLMLALITACVAIIGFAVFVIHRIRGYWIEHVPLEALRDDDDDFAILYHEGARKLMFLGRRRPKPETDVLFVPPEGSWNHRVEPWAQNRRAEILDRLRRDPVAGHCEVRSASLP